MKLGRLFAVLFLAVFFVSFASASFVYSNPQFASAQSTYSNMIGSGTVGEFQQQTLFNSASCAQGQDFVFQVDPLGCEPTIVRSDLLGSQPAYVMCPIKATKVNPLIDINSIRSINLRTDNVSMPGVSAGFYPSQVTTDSSTSTGLNSLLKSNTIGYALIKIPQQPNETALPNYVSGNLTAQITYDLQGGFGLVTQKYYLPVMSDSNFSRNIGNYAFFNKMGYLRADSISSDGAQISIYSRLNQQPLNSQSDAKQKINSFNLKTGETSQKVLLPGFQCLSAVSFTLDSITYPDVRAVLNVGGDILQLRTGQTFLNGECTVQQISYTGANQDVTINCKQSANPSSTTIGSSAFGTTTLGFSSLGSTTFTLQIDPTVQLRVDNGIKENKQVGAFLYNSTDGKKSIYLAYVTAGNNAAGQSTLEGLSAYLVALPSDQYVSKLTGQQLQAAAQMAVAYGDSAGSPKSYFEITANRVVNLFSKSGTKFDSSNFNVAKYGASPTSFADKKVTILGYGIQENDPLNYPQNPGLKGNYTSAIKDYDTVQSQFPSTKYPSSDSYTTDERSLYQEINLSFNLHQYSDLQKYCQQFEKLYTNSPLDVSSFCNNYLTLSNAGVSTKTVQINGKYVNIAFQSVSVPSAAEYSADLTVTNTQTGASQQVNLRKGRPFIIDGANGDSIVLNSLSGNSASVSITAKKAVTVNNALQFITNSETLTVGQGAQNFGTKYSFTLDKVNLQKVAEVTVHPSVNNDQSMATFPFKIAIEKRAFQLSPQKAEAKAVAINNSIQTWQRLSDNLGKVVQGMKTACLAEGAWLTAKNLIHGSSGEVMARQEVMKYWKVNCTKQTGPGQKYSTLDACYLGNSNTIDQQVSKMQEIMKTQQGEIATLVQNAGSSPSANLMGGTVVNKQKLAELYGQKLQGQIDSYGCSNVDLNALDNFISTGTGYQNGVYTSTDFQNLELAMKTTKLMGQNNQVCDQISSLARSAKTAQDLLDQKKQAEAESKTSGSIPYTTIVNTKNQRVVKITIQTSTKARDLSGKPQAHVLIDSTKYIVGLVQSAGGFYHYVAGEAYYDNGTKVTGTKLLNSIQEQLNGVNFESGTAGVNQYPFSGIPKVQYYEVAPYKGDPAIVPIEKTTGWYVYVQNTLPTFGSSTNTYDTSGRINSFMLCNVGPDGLISVDSSGNTGDDFCQTVDLGNVQTDFANLDPTRARQLITEAVTAVNQAKQQYRNGVSSVTILKQTYPVGAPFSSTSSSTSCEDYMSPKQCNTLFNLCDPVICPSDRCNFGGKYPVADVQQSGIIGGIALCLPNYPQVKVPVCLTGIKAGMDNFISVMKDYSSCLDTQAKTGQTTGVCDEVNSIYMCEFFWRQAIPLAKVALPELLSSASKQNTKGGGSYSNVAAAWANAQSSITFFTNSYAVNAFKAFKARSQSTAGSAACKNFISIAYPNKQGMLSLLTQSNSPPQYYANFDEIPYTTATNPPTSQYKVYFHIFAGNDQGATYRVYFQPSTSSYYQDASTGRILASGYIAKGGSADKTVNLLAPSGYKSICIQVNDQEQCGFGQATTSFLQNYVKDQYLNSQVNQTNITTQQECISGTTSLLGLTTTPNLEAGVSNSISPNIAKLGITRVCATSNPGLRSDTNIGTSNSQWVPVGTCGSPTLKCWLNTQSAASAFNFQYDANKSLNASIAAYVKSFAPGKVVTDADFQKYVDNITNAKTPWEKLSNITVALDHVVMNNQKAYLYYLEGNVYSGLAQSLWIPYQKYLESIKPSAPLPGTEGSSINGIYVKDPSLKIFDSANFASSNFYIESGSKGNLYYKYFNGGWYWSISPAPYAWNKMPSTMGLNSALYQKEIAFISTFKSDTNYSAGLQKILNFNYKAYGYYGSLDYSNYTSFDGNIFDIHRTTIGSRSSFTKAGRVMSSDMYLHNTGGKWYWSLTNPPSVSWTAVTDKTTEVKTSVGSTILAKIKSIFSSKRSLAPSGLEQVTVSGEFSSILDSLSSLDSSQTLSPTQKLIYGSAIIFSNQTILDQLNSLYSNSGGQVNWAVVNPNCSKYYNSFLVASNQQQLPLNLLIALINQESHCNPYAVSSTGAAGLGQFTSSTASKDYSSIFGNGVKACSNVDTSSGTGNCKCSVTCNEQTVQNLCGCDPQDPRFDSSKSIEASSAYLSQLISRYSSTGDKYKFALLAYNGGQTVVDGLINKLKETHEGLNWSNAQKYLTADFIYPYYSSYSVSWRDKKVTEMINYVNNIVTSANEISPSSPITPGWIVPYTSTSVALESSTFPGKDTIDKLNSEKWPVTSTLNFCDNFPGNEKYGDYKNNTYFVDSLHNSGVLIGAQYDQIVSPTNFASFFGTQKDSMSNVCLTLREIAKQNNLQNTDQNYFKS